MSVMPELEPPVGMLAPPSEVNGSDLEEDASVLSETDDEAALSAGADMVVFGDVGNVNVISVTEVDSGEPGLADSPPVKLDIAVVVLTVG